MFEFSYLHDEVGGKGGVSGIYYSSPGKSIANGVTRIECDAHLREFLNAHIGFSQAKIFLEANEPLNLNGLDVDEPLNLNEPLKLEVDNAMSSEDEDYVPLEDEENSTDDEEDLPEEAYEAVPGKHDYYHAPGLRLLPPDVPPKAGRPKKARMKGADEIKKKSIRKDTAEKVAKQAPISIKKGGSVTCWKCLQMGHNKATCKNDFHPNSPLLKGKTSFDGGYHRRGAGASIPTPPAASQAFTQEPAS
ncbi:unnamed protein product [Cuscuta campestris]|uniref:Uncharacterized protein n=1 Tax=Cuscuta campestris TaxID=132261 RepID=A0A484M8K5_9ASTE|nr:unnamed protein product [Cuscuta campestris]